MSPEPGLTIAVLTYRFWEKLLPDCLYALARARKPVGIEMDLLVIDNGASPSVDVTRANNWYPGARVVHLPQNVGNIGGQNACFLHARHPWVLFVADDVRLFPNAIVALYRGMEDADTPTICQPILCNPNGTTDNCGLSWRWPGYGTSVRRIRARHSLDAVTASCYLMRWGTWELLGGFDEGLHSSHEDIDFCLRARRLGYRMTVVPHALALHLGNQTLRHTLSNVRDTFHQARLRVIDTHYTGWDRRIRRGVVKILDGIRRRLP